VSAPEIRFDREWPAAMFETIAPAGAATPIVAHMPHASTLIPADVRVEILVDNEDLRDEVTRLTDWYTDDLFTWLTTSGAMMFVNRLSRLVFDPERFLDDTKEPMAARGQGVVYTHGTRGQRLRHDDAHLRERRIEELYRPYHAALDALVGDVLERFGRCLLIDCHSFPGTPLPSELDQAPDRPDICIGTDPGHTPPSLAQGLEREFVDAGMSVKRDSPFAGTFVPSGFHRRDARVHSVMIEVNRDLYLDGSAATRSARYESTTRALQLATTRALAGDVLA